VRVLDIVHADIAGNLEILIPAQVDRRIGPYARQRVSARSGEHLQFEASGQPLRRSARAWSSSPDWTEYHWPRWAGTASARRRSPSSTSRRCSLFPGVEMSGAPCAVPGSVRALSPAWMTAVLSEQFRGPLSRASRLRPSPGAPMTGRRCRCTMRKGRDRGHSSSSATGGSPIDLRSVPCERSSPRRASLQRSAAGRPFRCCAPSSTSGTRSQHAFISCGHGVSGLY
jgi:hypothetical protein